MTQAAHYTVDLGWALILSDLGLSGQDILRAARLPLDLFQRPSPTLASAEYFRLWEAAQTVSGDPLLPLRFIERLRPEAFSPPLFACLCSETLNAALDRLARYKPLIGPMVLEIERDGRSTHVTVAGLPEGHAPPASLLIGEVMFLVQLARLGTRERIAPQRVTLPVSLPNLGPYADWLGCVPGHAPALRVSFRRLDAERPFLTANPGMWAAFEPGLRQRLDDLTPAASTAERVRAWLNEHIAAGRIGVGEAARDLGLSPRTLQRRLAAEGTSFQQEINGVRTRLSLHYLRRTRLSVGEIAFLLGYAETNSFYRAFQDWTGTTPDAARSGTTAAGLR